MTKTMKQCWTVINHTVMPDRRNGGTMMRVTFQNLATQVTADTYICAANRNARNWTQVLHNLGLGQVISDLQIIKRNGKCVISADSEPEVVWAGDADLLQQKLQVLWAPKNNFGDLFN